MVVRHSAGDRHATPVGGPPRARGAVSVGVQDTADGVTRLQDLRQSGALKLLFPRTFGPDCTGVLVNTAGGLTGGDRLEIAATAGPGARLTLTTQAAERVYRAASGTATVATHLQVAAGAQMLWLPQETILFDRSALRRSLRVDLSGDAGAVLVEPLVLGRAAMGEVVRTLQFDDRIAVYRDGALIFCDAVRLHGPGMLAAPAGLGGHRAAVQMVIARPGAADLLDGLRTRLSPHGGASALGPDLVVMRLLAADSFALRRTLLPILDDVTGQGLPTCWRL